MQQMLWIFFAILIVLALIGATAWLVRRFAGNSIGASGGRGRMPRLAVIDAAAVDGRRRLVLVRRDNVEHLLMIGGPSDIVVEPNIVRSAQPRDQAQPRAPLTAEPAPRIAPLPESNNWDNEPAQPEIFDFPEPVAPQPRAPRPAFTEEPRRVPVSERVRNDDIGGLIPDPAARVETPRPERARPATVAPRSEPRLEPSMPRMPRSAELAPKPVATAPAPSRANVRPAEAASSAADQNLAEMAQRLEAALRRPGGSAPRAEANVAITPGDRVGAPSVAPDAAAPGSAPTARPAFDNLEDEMASLLGRPKNPT